jgi:hypothetical protein
MIKLFENSIKELMDKKGIDLGLAMVLLFDHPDKNGQKAYIKTLSFDQ